MAPSDWQMLATITSVAVFMGGGGYWLRGQFSDMKDHFSKVISDHKAEDNARFQVGELRMQRLEIETFGASEFGAEDYGVRLPR